MMMEDLIPGVCLTTRVSSGEAAPSTSSGRSIDGTVDLGLLAVEAGGESAAAEEARPLKTSTRRRRCCHKRGPLLSCGVADLGA